MRPIKKVKKIINKLESISKLLYEEAHKTIYIGEIDCARPYDYRVKCKVCGCEYTVNLELIKERE